MKKIFVLAVASLIASSAYAGELKWNGSAGWRFKQYTYDDGLNSTDTSAAANSISKQKEEQQNIRANFGFTGGGDGIEYGLGVRTTASANSDYTQLQNNGDRTFGLDQAYFRYLHDFGFVDLNVTVGRQKNVFAYEGVTQNLFSNTVRWDGFGWNFKLGNFGLNAAQYFTGAVSGGTQGATKFVKSDSTQAGANTQGHFNVLYGFQPTVNWKFTDEIDTLFAVGYYIWIDDTNYNLAGGGYKSTNTNTAYTAPAYFSLQSPRQWQFLNSWNLPYDFAFKGELVINKKSNYQTGASTSAGPTTQFASYQANTTATTYQGNATAWTLGLVYGKVKKAHDWSLSYFYGDKGIGSVINAYADSNFIADNNGHRIEAKYNLADNLVIGARAIMIKEKAKVQSTGANAGLAYSGASANQAQKQNYLQLTADVTF